MYECVNYRINSNKAVLQTSLSLTSYTQNRSRAIGRFSSIQHREALKGARMCTTLISCVCTHLQFSINIFLTVRPRPQKLCPAAADLGLGRLGIFPDKPPCDGKVKWI